MNEHFFIYNKQFFRAGLPVISAQNRSMRYGDGLFETMRMHDGRILNLDFHFERLFDGMKMLELELPATFSKDFFLDSVNELIKKNFISANARIRLMVFRGDEGLFDIENNSANFVIEAFPVSSEMELNIEGLKIDIFPHTRKSCDRFSNIKSNNYLPSIMAARYAKKNNLDDAIILNAFGRVCESSIASVFIVKDEKIYTPPLSEGCVAGVMRRWLLEKLPIQSYPIEEKPLQVEEVLSADEVFLTNAVQPLKWVEKFRNKMYENKKVKEIFKYFIENI